MQFLKQSTGIRIRVGPFMDYSDGVSPVTTVDLTTADEAELLKNDGAATVDISGAAWTAIADADGWYNLTLTASHTDTLGHLTVVVQDQDLCLPVFKDFTVVSGNVFDSLMSGSDYLQVDAVQIGGVSAASQISNTTAIKATTDKLDDMVEVVP